MFGNIRRKLTDVIHEGLNISDTLSSTHIKPSSSQKFDFSKTDFGIPSGINLSAGCNLVARNEEIWRSLHENSEQNASRAESLDMAISKIKDRTGKLYVDLIDINACVSVLPRLTGTLKSCTEMISNVGILCRSLETKLAELEDVTEEIELQQRQLEHKVEMSLYTQKKMAHMEEVRLKLSRQHVENVTQYEDSLKKIQQERQAVFQDAFQNDMEIFRKEGTLPKVEYIRKASIVPEISLEEITLDDPESKNELEDFLKE